MAHGFFMAKLNERIVGTIGVYMMGLATMGAGIFDLIWGEFEAAHQPIGALGDHVPGEKIFAYLIASCMIASGAAILNRKTARFGSFAAIVIYLIFGLFWLPRFYTAPHALGFSVGIFIGVAAGMFTQLIVVAGCLVLYSSLGPNNPSSLPTSVLSARILVGLGACFFGLVHLTSVPLVAVMIPKWVPLGGPFWVVVSGIAFLLAGISILTGVLNVLAAHLLALMLLFFELPVLIPLIVASPHNHVAWGASAYNLAAAGALCIFAAATGGPRLGFKTQSA